MAVESRLQSTLLDHKLDSGLQMIGQHIPGVESAASMFWVLTGSRDETPDQSGISHFLEHMAFKGTATRTYTDINREFEEIGAENNAFTWLEMTAYYARVLGDKLPRAIDLVADVTRPRLDPADFDQERNVILEEIARHRDQPYSLVLDEFFQTFFPDQPLGRSTLGSPETIKALTVDDMRRYWEERYGANNMIFSIAGNFEWDDVISQVSRLTSSWHTNEVDRNRSLPHPAHTRHVMAGDRWNQEHIVLGVPSIKQGDRHYYTASVLNNILGDDTGSRLFWSVNQTGLADQVGSSIITFSDAGVLFVLAVTQPDKASETLRVIREEMSKLQTGIIENDELERAKIKLMTSTIIEGESTMARMMGLVDSWLARGRLEALEEVRAGIEAVTVEDINDLLATHPLTQNQVLTALGPLAESQIA